MNKIITKGQIAEIILCDYKGNERARTIIDVEDINKIKKYNWHVNLFNNIPYVSTNLNGSSVYLPNVLLNFKSSTKVRIDHKNRKTLDNRKKNLRICTHAQNLWNRGKPKNNTSGYKGVSWDKEKRKWTARIMYNSNLVQIGRYPTKRKAAKAYNVAALKYHGEFAWINQL